MKPKPTNPTNIQLAAELLRQGKLVAIPTETVYGLGADAKNPEAVKKIFVAKGRPSDHPLIVHIADVSDLPHWAVEIPPTAYTLAEKYWPGPLTLVLKKHPSVPYQVTGGQETIAIRIPNHPVALAVLQAFGGGIAAPSANRFCRISPTQASHVEEELGDKVDMILDGGACEVGLESTIVDLSQDNPRLLRPGQINKIEIELLLGVTLQLPEINEQIHAPGAMEVHYSPEAATLLCTSEQIQKILNGEVYQHNYKIGVLTYNFPMEASEDNLRISMSKEADAYAHDLYDALHRLDNAWADIILIEQPPQSEEWIAINDRLGKAAKKFDEAYESKEKEYDFIKDILLTLSAVDWF